MNDKSSLPDNKMMNPTTQTSVQPTVEMSATKEARHKSTAKENDQARVRRTYKVFTCKTNQPTGLLESPGNLGLGRTTDLSIDKTTDLGFNKTTELDLNEKTAELSDTKVKNKTKDCQESSLNDDKLASQSTDNIIKLCDPDLKDPKPGESVPDPDRNNEHAKSKGKGEKKVTSIDIHTKHKHLQKLNAPFKKAKNKMRKYMGQKKVKIQAILGDMDPTLPSNSDEMHDDNEDDEGQSSGDMLHKHESVDGKGTLTPSGVVTTPNSGDCNPRPLTYHVKNLGPTDSSVDTSSDSEEEVSDETEDHTNNNVQESGTAQSLSDVKEDTQVLKLNISPEGIHCDDTFPDRRIKLPSNNAKLHRQVPDFVSAPTSKPRLAWSSPTTPVRSLHTDERKTLTGLSELSPLDKLIPTQVTSFHTNVEDEVQWDDVPRDTVVEKKKDNKIAKDEVQKNDFPKDTELVKKKDENKKVKTINERTEEMSGAVKSSKGNKHKPIVEKYDEITEKDEHSDISSPEEAKPKQSSLSWTIATSNTDMNKSSESLNDKVDGKTGKKKHAKTKEKKNNLKTVKHNIPKLQDIKSSLFSWIPTNSRTAKKLSSKQTEQDNQNKKDVPLEESQSSTSSLQQWDLNKNDLAKDSPSNQDSNSDPHGLISVSMKHASTTMQNTSTKNLTEMFAASNTKTSTRNSHK
ncbi:uncharacterized protein LOC131937742 [Physella acuta]|uniref:uncharacterized protein LOC131937742 n=1 Tax=Physella acuta TaxID=109671 RepID=UPI0027DBEC56|nr:uncharacterized protein LOC131937742 [Physella acuta]